jgi:hypothetical protein
LQGIVLRNGIEVGDPLGVALDFLEKYPVYDSGEPLSSGSFDESDLRQANRGGARISAAEQVAILDRRGQIERALRRIDSDASLIGRVP